MKVVKLYRKPDNPEFYKFVRADDHAMLVVYPISSPDSKRSARWFYFDEVYVDWIKEFCYDTE